MEFNARKITGIYRELTIEDTLATMSSGLLDYRESLVMAAKLISAAEDILPSDYNDQCEILSQIRGVLDE